jgi:EF-P beta-lysylation protein EpmB
LQQAVTDPDELVSLLKLDPKYIAPARHAARSFRLKVPRGFISRMRVGDPNDPLLRQVLPLASELDIRPGFVADPVGDHDALAGPGILQKYSGRALMITTGACAVHCRYCFRRNFPYGEQSAARREFDAALNLIRQWDSLSEVILSGGDPLTLTDRRLEALAGELQAVPHVRRLRVHTRLPIVIPERLDERFLEWWSSLTIEKVLVVHANHAREINAQVRDSLLRLQSTRTTVLNQSVLLRGVNDNVDALEDLSATLFSAGVLPYYLHLLDPVSGAHHFEVPEEEARDYVTQLSNRLPGYLVPRLAREIPGAPAKQIVPPVSR